MKPYKYCHYCGTEYSSVTDPYECHSCNKTVWVNPVPVIVVALPLSSGPGFLGILRGDPAEPGYGKEAFVSGFIDKNEDWMAAGIREIKEETGLVVKSLTIKKIVTINNMLLLLATSEEIDINNIDWEFSNKETTKLVQLSQESKLAFPVQQDFLNSFY